MAGQIVYRWPPRVRLAFYGRKDVLLFSSRDRNLDLADSLLNNNQLSRTLRMGMSTDSTRWEWWSDENLKKIEALIRYDFSFDGFRVTIKRLTTKKIKCENEFRWSLRVQLA